MEAGEKGDERFWEPSFCDKGEDAGRVDGSRCWGAGVNEGAEKRRSEWAIYRTDCDQKRGIDYTYVSVLKFTHHIRLFTIPAAMVLTAAVAVLIRTPLRRVIIETDDWVVGWSGCWNVEGFAQWSYNWEGERELWTVLWENESAGEGCEAIAGGCWTASSTGRFSLVGCGGPCCWSAGLWDDDDDMLVRREA